MRYFYLLILTVFTIFNAYSQESSAFKNYLQKVKSPIYLDGQVGLTPFLLDYDVTAFFNVSSGIQISKNIGVGVDYSGGFTGNHYDNIAFRGTGLQLRFKTPAWIIRGSYGKIDNAEMLDDSYYNYVYVPTKRDAYWRVDAGIRFWRIMAFSASVMGVQNVFFDSFKEDIPNNEFLFVDRINDNNTGVTLTLSVLLPPLRNE